MIFNHKVHRDMQTVKYGDHRNIMIKQASVIFVFLTSCPLWLNNKMSHTKI